MIIDDNKTDHALARKRSVAIAGHRTSFSLEDIFFADLLALAEQDEISLAALVTKIDETRPRDSNLSSALRLHVLEAAKAGRLS